MKSALIEKFRATHGRAPEVLAQAPGRIEFIGNHTDYNGGTVLGAAIDRGVWVAVARRADGLRRFASDQRGQIISVPALQTGKLSGPRSWANYPLGVLAAFPHFGLQVPAGFDYLALSNLPPGAGLSSSAAIELSSALAFAELVGERPARETLVKAARHAENHFVGVPCGILDQGVSGFGKKDHLVFIDCRGPRFETVPLPGGAHFWIFNTHTKHALVDGLYAARHRECTEAAKALGVALLVEVSPAALADGLGKLSPVAGRRARHIVEEIARVDATVVALRRRDLATVGKLLTASHRSSQTLFENSTAELDFLVDTLGAAPHVFGARLTGGGFGGAVMALTAAEFGETEARLVATAYAGRFGPSPDILHTQTGDGAALHVP
jgi:galactokinase